MRILILMLLLAVSAKAIFGEVPHLPSVPSNGLLNESTKSTTPLKTVSTTLKTTTTSTPATTTTKSTTTSAKANPLPYGKEISKDIMKFAENLLKETLHLKTFKCAYPKWCFPLDLSTLAIEDLVAIKAFLKEVYADDYEKIMAIPAVDNNVWSEYLKIYGEMQKTITESILMWNEIWEQMENNTVFTEKGKKTLRGNNAVIFSLFLRIHDIKEGRKALERLRKVFTPALNAKSSAQALSRALRTAELLDLHRLSSLQSFSGNELNDILFDKKKEIAEIEDIIRRLFYYVQKTDPATKKLLAISFDENLVNFSDLSLSTVVVFKFYLLEAYGSVLKEIPMLPMTSTAERHEKLFIVNGIKQIWDNTIDAWSKNFNSFIHGNFTSEPKEVKDEIQLFAVFLGDFLDLKELRFIHRNALAVLGKGFDVIKRNPRFSGQAANQKKSLRLEMQAEDGSEDIQAGDTGKYVDKDETLSNYDGQGLEDSEHSVDIFVAGSETIEGKDNN